MCERLERLRRVNLFVWSCLSVCRAAYFARLCILFGAFFFILKFIFFCHISTSVTFYTPTELEPELPRLALAHSMSLRTARRFALCAANVKLGGFQMDPGAELLGCPAVCFWGLRNIWSLSEWVKLFP